MTIGTGWGYILEGVPPEKLFVFVLILDNRLYMMNFDEARTKVTVKIIIVEITCTTFNTAINCVMLNRNIPQLYRSFI